MSWHVAEEPEEGPEADRDDDSSDDSSDDGMPDEEVEGPSVGAADDDDDDDVEPLTHLSDRDYDAFVTSELTPEGAVKGDPPVAAILIGLTLLIVLLWLWLA